jgi:hypothetical protein
MASLASPTCIAGLDLALKWVGRGSDPEVARCTAAVAWECDQRGDCPSQTECLQRLRDIETLLDTLLPPSVSSR